MQQFASVSFMFSILYYMYTKNTKLKTQKQMINDNASPIVSTKDCMYSVIIVQYCEGSSFFYLFNSFILQGQCTPTTAKL